jgi:hypothetical protein
MYMYLCLLGAIYIYKQISNTWTYASKLIAYDAMGFDLFGASVYWYGSNLYVGVIGRDVYNATNAGKYI